MVGTLVIGEHVRNTRIRFRNVDGFGFYINLIDDGYDSQDAIFNGHIYQLSTPQFNIVKRSQYGNGCDFKHEIIEYCGNICFIPRKSYCFIKSFNFLTDEGYKQNNLDFNRIEDRRSNIMRLARIQPCFKRLGISLGY